MKEKKLIRFSRKVRKSEEMFCEGKRKKQVTKKVRDSPTIHGAIAVSPFMVHRTHATQKLHSKFALKSEQPRPLEQKSVAGERARKKERKQRRGELRVAQRP